MRRLLLSTLTLAACQAHDPQHLTWDADVANFMGQSRIERMDTATEVRALRVEDSRGLDTTGRALASGFPITAEGPLLTDPQRTDFMALVRDAANYEFDMSKACVFSPGVALRFDGPAGRLEALVCFSCDEWAFAIPTATGELESWVVEDCDAARAGLLRVAKQLFPGDAALAKLN